MNQGKFRWLASIEELDKISPLEETFNENKRSLSSLVMASYNKSSIPAISHIRNSDTKFRKYFWSLALLVTSCVCIYEVHKFFCIYLEYPVITDLKIDSNLKLIFPAVTFCNLNRMKREYMDCTDKSFKKCIEGKFSHSVSNLLPHHDKIYSENNAELHNDSDKTFPVYGGTNTERFVTKYMKLDTSSKRCYGHLFHELVQKCSFQSNPCSKTEFSYHHSVQFGNCYTFNANPRDLMAITERGSTAGLEMDLNIHEEQYLDLTQSSGLRLVIHNRDEQPNLVENGINISPGFETQVALTKVSRKRLPKPFKDGCKKYDYETTVKSQHDCIVSCKQRYSLYKCFCTDPFIPHAGLKPCDLGNLEDKECLNEVMNSFVEGNITCDCPLSCSSETYDLLVSSSSLPSDTNSNDPDAALGMLEANCTYDYNLFKKWIILGDATHYNKSLKFLPSRVSHFREKRNVNASKSNLKLKVYFKTLDQKIYTQKARYLNFQLLAHLGGFLAFWLGTSIAVIFEMAENFLRLILYYIKIYI
ncbi:degenerin-like protein asic-2 [Parasteatoda tepidariorum]|uniref:degenerin-like protein asic-2 n=1 Tax=Parasteatoda tepidariorum TaxID=114398 RepID=UPI001C71BBF5|nr:degenerin-like protein asic-2 [Parasteatoda tepidariorum]